MILSAEWLAARIEDRTTRGIALTTAALIRSGEIAVGTHLPPVRELALQLGVSASTVSAAWSELRRFRAIAGKGRNGVWVCGDITAPRPARFQSNGDFRGHALDLTYAAPDPALLPPLDKALRHATSATDLNDYHRTPIIPELRRTVERRWPYLAEAYLAANGGYAAVHMALHALVMPGSVIACETPAAMRLLDILENLGAQLIPVSCDAHGPEPASLAKALSRNPAAFVYQPRTHSVTGHMVSPERMDELAGILAGSKAMIIEDDGIGGISSIPPQSLGSRFPERVIHILSYSKTLGPDLRLAVLSGPDRIVRQIQAYRSFGDGWTSRLLQSAAAWLIEDAETGRLVDKARAIYRERRQALVDELRSVGLDLPDNDGLCLWLPVASEQFALITLAVRGIAVLAGEKCTIGDSCHIRVATSMLADGAARIAKEVALVLPDRAIDHGQPSL